MKQLRWLAPLFAVLLVGAFSVAVAHEGHEHGKKTVMGTVKKVDQDQNKVEIETPDGTTMMVRMMPDTVYTKDGEELTMHAMEPGMRVAMDVTEGENGQWMCHRVQMGAMMEGMMGGMHGMQGSSGMQQHDAHHKSDTQKDQK